jgi:hypothetical protein
VKLLRNISGIILLLALVAPNASIHLVVHVASALHQLHHHYSDHHTGLADFIADHTTGNNTHHHHHDEHEDLPLNHRHCNADNFHPVTILADVVQFQPSYLPGLQQKQQFLHPTLFISQAYIHAIWQPPKRCC